MSNLIALSTLTASAITLIGCRPAIVEATVSSPAQPSAVSAPELPIANPTQAPTPSPEPASTEVVVGELAPKGSWLVGSSEGGIVGLNIDGTGRTALVAPPLWQVEQDIVVGDGVSPSGWIAARTGVPNDWSSSSNHVSAEEEAPTEVGIAIWKLPGSEPLRFIPRFSGDLVAGMLEVRDFDLPYSEQATGPRWKYDMVFLALYHEDARLFWSPDGRYLAFAAALDGPSADVYVYDTLADEVRRLTEGPNQAVLLGWSPDGQWILHYDANEYAISHGEIIGFPAEVLWAVSVDGSQVHRLGEGQGIPWVSGWLSPNTVVLTVWTAYSSLPHQLWSIDLDTGIRVERQDFSFFSVAVGPASDTIAVIADARFDADGSSNEGGVFVLSPENGDPRGVDFDQSLRCSVCPIDWAEPLGLFFMYSLDNFEERGAILGFLRSGEIVRRFEEEFSTPLVSPDGNWVAFIGGGVRIYDSDGEIKLDVPGGRVSEALWSPDSAELFYLEGEAERMALNVLAVPEGRVTLLHPDVQLIGLHLTQGEAAD